jgi:ATP-dependent RNA helicase RhlE
VPTFADLALLPTLVQSLSEQGMEQPTPIQERAIPALLEGRALVGVAETGSGKTLAFALPLLHRIKSMELSGSMVEAAGRPRALVLVPGRELGEQVSRVFKGLTHGTRVRVRTVLGGSRKQIARQNVKGAFEVLVATPGRLEQLTASGGLSLEDVRILVFDEADRILDAGFLPSATRVVAACPKGVQLVMVSATLSPTLERAVASLFQTKPLRVRTQGSQQTVHTLKTDNRDVRNGMRSDLLTSVIAEAPELSTILFVNTRDQCDTVAQWLDDEGLAHVSYRGEMDRKERRINLTKFRKGTVSLMVSTDLGGRGLDIPSVGRVINVFLPRTLDNYLHRVGRTARAGRAGLVVNLVTGRDQTLLATIRKREAKRK